jgi:uncharacterized protein GlcG (DUF336 family)
MRHHPEVVVGVFPPQEAATAKQVTLEAAERVIGVCRRKAEELGQPMCIAVVDGGANLVAFVRMDNSLQVAADIAVRKALTAAEFRMDTRELTPLVRPGARCTASRRRPAGGWWCSGRDPA